MTLEQLRIFVGVAEREHMTRAAEALHITQSAVSAAIKTLEERHNVPLFHRIGRRIELTAAGRLFLVEARAVLGRAASAERTLAEFGGLERGTLTLVASQVALSFGIPFALVPLVRLAHDEAVMGERRTGRAQHVLLWVVVGLVVGLNLALLALLVIG